MKRAVLMVSHGSRSAKTKQELSDLVARLRSKTGIQLIRFAFLELESPDIPQGIDECIQQGADEIVILLNFLNSGRHVDEDIPAIIDRAKEKHPDVTFKISSALGLHDGIVDLFARIIKDI